MSCASRVEARSPKQPPALREVAGAQRMRGCEGVTPLTSLTDVYKSKNTSDSRQYCKHTTGLDVDLCTTRLYWDDL